MNINDPTMEEVLEPVEQPAPVVPDELDYNKMRIRIDKLIGWWKENQGKAAQREKERYIDINVDRLRAAGDIAPDETVVPNRIIDANIGREFPDYMAFLKQSHRAATFECISAPDMDTASLEEEFTDVVRYGGWYDEFVRFVDGAMLHGMDYIKVCFDETKPGHVAFEHIGYENFLFNPKTKPEDSDFVLIKHCVTLSNLRKFIHKYQFNEAQVRLIEEEYRDEAKRDDTIEVYETYIMVDGVVHYTWYTKQSNVTDWLKEPTLLRLGIKMPVQEQVIVVDPGTGLQTLQTVTNMVDADITEYPVFTLIYKQDASSNYTEKKGRAFLDGPTQEATTALTSAFVNGCYRASNVYASPETDIDESVDIKQIDTQLTPGGIYNRKLAFWSMEFPDVSMLSGLNYLNSNNAAQAGNQDFAVMNRKDSRKTAKELDVATAETSQIKSVGLANFSETLRRMYAFTWKIVQSQALQGLIDFMLVPGDVQGQYVTDMITLQQEYDIKPAGDVDFVEREALINQMKNDWAVVQTTPLRDQFLLDLMALSYPKKAKAYRKILEQGNVGKQLVAGLGSILQIALQPAEVAALPPEKQQELAMLQQQAQAYLQQP